MNRYVTSLSSLLLLAASVTASLIPVAVFGLLSTVVSVPCF